MVWWNNSIKMYKQNILNEIDGAFETVFNAYYGKNYELLENKMCCGWNAKSYYFKYVTSYVPEW